MSWFSTLQPPAQAAVISAAVSAIVTVGLAIASPLLQRPLERLKSGLSGNIELLKARLADQAAAASARRSYEFDARKRLYAEIEPLLFQLFEATENSYYRVASLIRSHRQGVLEAPETSWLRGPNGYYFNSSIFFLFQPLAIYRLIQRSTTFVDLGLDDRIRVRYGLLKLSAWAFTDDFKLARYSPALTYKPEILDWKSARDADPAVHWRQGLYVGYVDRLIDALIVTEGDKRRPMTFGEFEDKARNCAAFQAALEQVRDIFLMFNFTARPVLARILLAHACLMRLLLLTYAGATNIAGLERALEAFVRSDEAKEDLVWWAATEPDHFAPVCAYLTEQLKWLSADHYSVKPG